MSLNEEIKITEDGGVIKKILQVGQGEETPSNGCNIQVTYIGTLVDGGKQFDANTDKENPFEFQVGVGQVIKGWDLGMITMKKGERALFTLSSEYAYGASGSPPTIPPNAALNFEVEMLDWVKNKGDYPENERFEKAATCKQNGNDFFKQGKFDSALEQYNEGEEWLETMYDNEKAVADQLLIRNNMAMVYLKIKDFQNAIKYATKVLEKEAQNQKALFRRGQAYAQINELQLAKADLKLAYELDNKNNAVIKELQQVQTKIKEQKQSEKQKFQNLFSKDFYNDKEDVKISEVVDNPSDPSNPRVFMDIKIGDAEPERIEFELYKNIVPKTAENFLQLCQTHYKNAIFHRNIKNFMIQGGDYENRNGTGGKSIYGEKFADENFNVHHTKRGQLSMANAGPNTNGSQFFVLYTNTPHLDGKHVVFGECCKNIELLDKLEAAETGAQDKPVQDIVIVDSGLVE